MDYINCSTNCNDSKIVVSENKSRFEVVNENRYEANKIQVDGCLIGEAHEKCDWIISCETPIKCAFFVELKGCNIDKAISQLASTLILTNKKFKDHHKKCFAVTTRIPKQNTTIRKKCIDFYDKNNVTLSVKNISNTVSFDS